MTLARYPILIAACASLTLAACGGGGGGGSTTTAQTPTDPPQSPAPEDPIPVSRPAPPERPAPGASPVEDRRPPGPASGSLGAAGIAGSAAPAARPRYDGALPLHAAYLSAPVAPEARPFTIGDAAWERSMRALIGPWGSRSPAAFLADSRQRTIQPALAEVNAHHAYARGFSGRGVVIAIDDDGVDIGNVDFFGRVRDEGSHNVYWRPAAYIEGIGAFDPCRRASARCRVYEVDARGDRDRVENFARRIVRADGYPAQDDTWFVRDTGASELFAWYEIPALWETGPAGGYVRGHGTQVASVALGWLSGIAPGAELAPSAFNFDEQWESQAIAGIYADWIDGFDRPEWFDVREFDADLAASIRADNANFDIVNKSHGRRADWNFELLEQHRDAFAGERWLRDNLPRTWAAVTQSGVRDSDKALEVVAAGNDGLFAPAPGAARAFRVPALRGLSFAVAALGADGYIARFSNRCGPLPSDWSAARDGRHYCLAAPGVDIIVSNPDPNPGDTEDDDGDFVSGTSFSAPLVAGGLAIVTEAFRGQLTPAEIGRRMVDTANDRGAYGLSSIYGAGVMDLDAATRPIGPAVVGTEARTALLEATRFVAPAAWGDVGARLAGVEVAAFDERNAPFWSPAGALFAAPAPRFPGPRFDDEGGIERLGPAAHLAWAEVPPRGARDPKLRIAAGAAPGAGLAPETPEWRGFGVSAQPFPAPFRVGLLAELDANQGAAPSGAFGGGARSQLAWVSREHQWRFGGRRELSVELDWLVAAGRADYPSGAMFDAGAAAYTAGSLALAHSDGSSRTRLALSQPLRAESGRGVFAYPVGRTPEGERLYARRRVPLRPDARELRLNLRRQHPLWGGEIVWEIGHARDAGHAPGRSASFGGAAWRVFW